MARVIEIEAETVDQALYMGLEQLKLSIDEIEMGVLDYGKKGFIGIGSKPAKVRLTVRLVGSARNVRAENTVKKVSRC